MKNIEYTQMAIFYDKFYAKKDYKKEVEFIRTFIPQKDSSILDAGCGTGNHAKILNDLGYNIHGFDFSADMVKLANEKIPEHFSVGNLLKFESEKKYDCIISFFAVFNHLKNYKEFSIALNNLRRCLNINGKIILDLHNPQKSGRKEDSIPEAKRIMQWKKCSLTGREISKITYYVNNKQYTTQHVFKIFQISKIKKIAKQLGFSNVTFYENYDVQSTATMESKNIQVIFEN